MRVASDLSVADSHPSLPGHFPGAPIVPGVVLLTLVVERLERCFGPFRVTGVRSVKLLRALRPADAFDLEAEAIAPDTLRFACVRGGERIAEGSLEVLGLAI